MEQACLKLKEIVWEITNKCNNNCWYCGSKERTKENYKINSAKILEIAKRICQYPPEEITISGGDPLLIDCNTHKEIVRKFKEVEIVSKIIINPKSLKRNQAINFYDVIGISINDENDLEIINNYCKEYLLPLEKINIVANFNIKNLYSFDKIKQFVKEKNLGWQIQYTVFKEEDNPLAIYNDDNAFLEFDKKVCESIKEGVKIIISDNANFNSCFAGRNILGITADGNILPCLSMVSWQEEKDVIEGNILLGDLETIWKGQFEKYRFGEYKCCKDHCKRKGIVKYQSEIEKKTDIEEFLDIPYKSIKQEDSTRVLMYGVRHEPKIMYYAVFNMSPASAYGLFNFEPGFYKKFNKNK